MKTTILAPSLILAALTLASCTRNDETITRPNDGRFEIYVSAATRTEVDADDADKTIWKASDAITVMHSEQGSATHINNGAFTIAAEDVASGRFGGTLREVPDNAKSYDWYAVYPHTEANGAAAAPTASTVNIAQQQTQTGNNSRAHICGANAPLLGTGSTTAGATPTIAMKHLTTLMKISVTNSIDSAAPITVSSIRLTASSRKITGAFGLSATNSLSFKSTAKQSATLAVENGLPIAFGGSADFYLAVAPFTAPTGGETLTILIILADGSTCTKDASVAAATAFEAGKINSLNVSVTTQYYQRFKSTSVSSGRYLIASTLRTETLPLVMNTAGRPTAAPADDLSAHYDSANDHFAANITTGGYRIDITRNTANQSPYYFELYSVAANTSLGAGFGTITYSSSGDYVCFKFTANSNWESESSITYDISNRAKVAIKYDPTTDTFKPSGTEGVRLYKLQ